MDARWRGARPDRRYGEGRRAVRPRAHDCGRERDALRGMRRADSRAAPRRGTRRAHLRRLPERARHPRRLFLVQPARVEGQPVALTPRRGGNESPPTLVVTSGFQGRYDMADKQDAIALLKADNSTVEELIEKFEGAKGDGAKEKSAMQICLELTVHAQIEEEIFYPACEGKIEEDLLKEAYVEHDGAKVLIAEIEAGGPDDEYYEAKVKVLSEQIEHHVEEEEKRMEGMFSQARKAGLDMDALGEELAARKQQLMAQAEDGGELPVKLSSMPAQPAPKATPAPSASDGPPTPT